jgi:hypothetical protein
MIGPTDPDPILPVPPAQQKKPDEVQAMEVKVLMVKPLGVNGFHVTTLPLTFVIEMTRGTTVVGSLPVPIATQKVVLLHTTDVMVLIVMPVWVKAVHVVPGADDPVLEKIVAPVAVVPEMKQIGCAVALRQTIWLSTVVVGIVSFVQVAVDPEMVALRTTPAVELLPIAMHAGVVALVGQTMLVSWVTPAGSVEVFHVVPLVDIAAAAPDEL